MRIVILSLRGLISFVCRVVAGLNVCSNCPYKGTALSSLFFKICCTVVVVLMTQINCSFAQSPSSRLTITVLFLFIVCQCDIIVLDIESLTRVCLKRINFQSHNDHINDVMFLEAFSGPTSHPQIPCKTLMIL